MDWMDLRLEPPRLAPHREEHKGHKEGTEDTSRIITTNKSSWARALPLERMLNNKMRGRHTSTLRSRRACSEGKSGNEHVSRWRQRLRLRWRASPRRGWRMRFGRGRKRRMLLLLLPMRMRDRPRVRERRMSLVLET